MEDLFKYFWMAFVAAVGGILGFISKVRPDLKKMSFGVKLRACLWSLAASMFTAYVVYEGALYFISSEGLAVALSGLASFAGTDLLLVLRKKIIESVKNKFDRI